MALGDRPTAEPGREWHDRPPRTKWLDRHPNIQVAYWYLVLPWLLVRSAFAWTGPLARAAPDKPGAAVAAVVHVRYRMCQLSRDLEPLSRHDESAYFPARRLAVIRGFSLLLAAGLVMVWAVGLDLHAAAWLTWLNGFAALAGFLVAAGPGVGPGHAVAPGRLVALGVGLGALAVVGFVRHASPWLSGCTLLFAFGFMIVGIAGEMSSFKSRTMHRPA